MASAIMAQLKQVQRGRPARNLDLDGLHKAVHSLHKGVRLRQVPPGPVWRQVRLLRHCAAAPSVARMASKRARVASLQGTNSGREGRPCAAAPGCVKAAAHALHSSAASVCGAPAPCAQHVHAQAAGLVHGGGAAFELPGHPQREADGSQRHQQEAHAHGQQLGSERPAGSHARRPVDARAYARGPARG
jgi:hypothetical protein